MIAADVVQAWIAERDAALEADGKGLDHSPGPSIAGGSWNGSRTEPADLRREVQLLRFLQRALAEDAEVEQARAAAGPPPLSREDARAVVVEAVDQRYSAGPTLEAVADAILDALGWPV